MKKILLLGVFLLCVTFIQATEVPFQKAEIKSITVSYTHLTLPTKLEV